MSGLHDMLLARVGGFEAFERGFNWRTFSPKKRAQSAVDDAASLLEAAIVRLAEAGIGPDAQQQWLASAIKKWVVYQSAGARTMNWMITGRARFPVERNNKALRVEAKRAEEFYQFCSGARDWARRHAKKAERRAVAATDAASGVEHAERAYGDVRVVLNKSLDRVQVFFPDKPSEEERRVLKRRAFRWAPSVGAWQRQLTQNGVWAAQAAMQDLGLDQALPPSAGTTA